jgi:hypothetical protein
MAEVTYPVLLDSTGQSMVAALNAIAGLTPSRGDVLAADFAQVEASSTSAHAYSVDDYLMLNDQLYKVTQPISIGDTITPETNVTATAVTDELGSGGGATSLGGLSDVTLTTPSSGQFLKYDGVKWVNGSGGGGGASALDDLTDVDITTPSDGQSLIYDSDTQKWVNGSGGGGGSSTLAGLSDVTISSATSGEVLEYNGSKWVNTAKGTAGHTIENSSGAGMPQRGNIQFTNCSVTDDSVNNKTVVTPGNIQTTTTDPGAGSALATNCLLFVIEE